MLLPKSFVYCTVAAMVSVAHAATAELLVTDASTLSVHKRDTSSSSSSSLPNIDNTKATTDNTNIVKLTLITQPTSAATTDAPSVLVVPSSSGPAPTTEGTAENSLFKILLTMATLGDPYYNAHVTVGTDAVDLRLDLLQPDIWVMDAESVLECNEVASWWSLELDIYTDGDLPKSLTLEPEYTASICAMGGLYTEPSATPTAAVAGVENGADYTLPYLSGLTASGRIATDNVSVLLMNG